MKQIRQQKTQQGRGLQKSRTSMTPTKAAHVIQSHWRRLVATKYVDQLRRREMIFLGMVTSWYLSIDSDRSGPLVNTSTIKFNPTL